MVVEKLPFHNRTNDEWLTVPQDILGKFEDNNCGGIYVKILVHEKLKLRLLEYCKKNISTINLYYAHLLPEYKNDIGIIFEKYINASASQAEWRSCYRDVCEIVIFPLRILYYTINAGVIY